MSRRSIYFIALLALSIALAGVLPVPAHGETGGLETLYPWPEDPTNLVQNPSFEALGANWKINLPSYFFPTTTDFHTGLWNLQLQDSNLAPYYPLATQAPALKPGWYTLRGWIKAVNAGTNTSGAGGRISLSRGNSPVVSGTTDWTQVERRSFPILPGESASVRLEAYRKPDGTIFFDDIEVHRQIPPAVEGFLLYPNYRGVLFEDRSQTIQVSVTVRPEEVGLTLADLAVRLFLETEGGLVVASQVVTPAAGQFGLSLDASAAPLGYFRLRLQALRAGSGEVLFEYPAYRIVKLSADARALLTTYVDSDNVLVVNGQRTFVLGIYDTSGYSNLPSVYEPRISKIAEAPINLYLNYWLGGTPVSALNALMTTLQRYGMAYLHTVNTWFPDSSNWPGFLTCNGQTANSLGQDGFTACMAAALGTNSGLAGWYTADERPADQVERVFHQYTVLRQNDPGGVTFIAQNRPGELVRWRDATDVMGVDPYPIYSIPEGSLSPLEMVTDWVEQAEAAVEGSRPVWGVIQFFKFGSNGHWPTYDELRTMSYMAIVAGAKGLFYWSYGANALSWVSDPTLKEEYWQRLVRVTTEIKSLEPALISPDAPEILSAYSPAGTIRVLAKQVGDTRYLITVNNTAQAGIVATFTLAAGGDHVEVIEEERTIPVNGTTFSDAFSPYQVHVYKIAAKPGSSSLGPANLVSNGDFENIDGNNKPVDWRLTTGAWSVTATQQHSGSISLQLKDADRQQYTPYALAKSVTVEPGTYVLSGWTKTQALGDVSSLTSRYPQGVRLSIRDESLSGNKNIASTPILNGTNDWQLLQREIMISKPGVYTVTIDAYGKPSGTAWIDQVSLVKK